LLATETPRPPPPLSLGTLRRTAEEVADYLAEVGALLTRYGCPAYRLEHLIQVVADLEGFDAESMSLPTALFVNVSPRVAGAGPVHRMVRLREWGVSLDKLLWVDEIFNDVAFERRTIENARAALRGLDERPPAYSRAWKWIAAAGNSAAAAVFFRGCAADVALAAGLGAVIYGLSRLLGRHPQAKLLVDFLGALVTSLTALVAARFWQTTSREVLVLAGLISLFPGMTLTTGLAELAHKNLVSGAARLMEAFMTFLAFLVGVAMALGLAQLVALDMPVGPARDGLGLPFQVLAVFVVSLGFGVSFSIPRRLLWTALVSGGISYAVTALGTRRMPGHIAAFLAAAAVCTIANGLARATGRPAQLYHLPGMMLLVPGSFGFLSLDSFLRGDLASGASKSLSMMLIGGGLVMGVLLANVVLPPRKLL
jgi:uncharacterized membrane protein YjjP (DUF1212 family)